MVRKIKAAEKTASGIYIPEKAQESLNRAVVLAVGPGTEENKVSLRAGDTVLLPNFGGYAVKGGLSSNLSANKEAVNEVLLDGVKEDEIFLYRESEILAKISES